MLVHRTDITEAERCAFEAAIRACGKDPGAFKAELFEATLADAGRTLRRVHVACEGGSAQYEASGGTPWTSNFARHLELGVFG